MDIHRIISDLIGRSYPPAILVDDRLRREWVARSVQPLPPQEQLSALQMPFEEGVFADIKLGIPSTLAPGLVAAARPLLMLLRLDDLHLIVRIDTAGPDCTIGTAAMIGTWGMLSAIHQQFEFEDLQGLPVSCWKLLYAARGGAPPKQGEQR